MTVSLGSTLRHMMLFYFSLDCLDFVRDLLDVSSLV